MSDELLQTHAPIRIPFVVKGQRRAATFWVPNPLYQEMNQETLMQLRNQIESQLVSREVADGEEFVIAAAIEIDIVPDTPSNGNGHPARSTLFDALAKGFRQGKTRARPSVEEVLKMFDRRDISTFPDLGLAALVLHTRLNEHRVHKLVLDMVREHVEDYQFDPDKPLCNCGNPACDLGHIERVLRAYDDRLESMLTAD